MMILDLSERSSWNIATSKEAAFPVFAETCSAYCNHELYHFSGFVFMISNYLGITGIFLKFVRNGGHSGGY